MHSRPQTNLRHTNVIFLGFFLKSRVGHSTGIGVSLPYWFLSLCVLQYWSLPASCSKSYSSSPFQRRILQISFPCEVCLIFVTHASHSQEILQECLAPFFRHVHLILKILKQERTRLIQGWLISSFPCSLTRNITSHSMKNLAFHSLPRWKMIILPNSYHLTTFLFEKLGECSSWTWEWKS